MLPFEAFIPYQPILMFNWTIFLAFGAIYLIWGVAYHVTCFGLNSIPPYLLSTIRYLVAGLIIFAWASVREGALSLRDSFTVNGIAGPDAGGARLAAYQRS